ncbi:phytanoyl-CoA dioxygenase family protein [Parathalassolituus penaei]|uniref:Phytanoyl-CoA dioxygenase family protein n=1 Tax=Parathalassolituus penaei TaxID=2997323 RepID=A0A9X3EGT3_9GAMM|nr:phytanoyl-CoA dioxygenase family protein [Parathalassolituus penaei]MCY0967308.1 phytanoyl-CoA dioxygenase family protein [Parathalassolituus penaei]
MWQIFSGRKSFADPVVGNYRLNRLGLHLGRIWLADRMLAGRRRLLGLNLSSAHLQTLKKDGIVVIHNFLPDDIYQQLKQQSLALMEQVDNEYPVLNHGDRGFGPKRQFKGGFDRFDGGSLNRFYDMPEQGIFAHWLNEPRLRSLVSLGAGNRFDNRFRLYRLRHGDEGDNPDNQRLAHKDTFHSSIKMWFSLSDVTLDDGPFCYAAGTHRMTRQRRQWEYQRSLHAARNNLGGAFRISEEDIRELFGAELKPYPVPENTLVLADVRGFHCRGNAVAGRERLSIYGSYRPTPFKPLP